MSFSAAAVPFYTQYQWHSAGSTNNHEYNVTTNDSDTVIDMPELYDNNTTEAPYNEDAHSDGGERET